MSSKRVTTRQFVKDRAAFRAQCKADNAPCWLCGQRHIDYEAKHDDYDNGDRFELDHFYPVSTHPELQHDTANFRPSAHTCNNDRSNDDARAGLGILSQEWV